MANVLLLEPDRVLARIYAQSLEHIGVRAYICQTGQEAIEVLDGFKANLIVMELQLAGHGGVEFLHELRSYPEWQAVPVLVNTSLTPQAIVPLRASLLRDAGVATCLYKPHTTLHQFIRAVREGIGVQQ